MPTESDGSDVVDRFENLPLLTQRALMRVAYAAIDSTEDEKRSATAALDRLAVHETAPDKLRELVKMLSSLVRAVQSQADMNYLARGFAGDEGEQDDEQQ